MSTILLIDDDGNTAEALGELLIRKGYAVAVARDGQQALDYLRSNLLPSLILLDLVMPGMDGWQFLAQRARDQRLSSIPVVITSAIDTNIPMNIAAVVRKPWKMQELEKVIQQLAVAQLNELHAATHINRGVSPGQGRRAAK